MTRYSHIAVIALVAWLLAPRVAHAQYRMRSLTCDSPKTCRAQCTVDVADACASLATMHQHGMQVRADVGQAAGLYDKACKLGDAWACLELADLSLQGWMFQVPRNQERFDEYFDRATKMADAGCSKQQGAACLTLAEIHHRMLVREQWADTEVHKRLEPMMRAAKIGCTAGHTDSCRWLHDRAEALGNRGLLTEQQVERHQKDAHEQFPKACGRGDINACYQAGRNARTRDKKRSFYEPACDQGHAYACRDLLIEVEVEEMEVGDLSEAEAAKLVARLIARFFASCDGRGHEDCGEVLEVLFKGEPDFALERDVKRGLAQLESQCRWGARAACATLGKLLADGDDKLGIARDSKRARGNLERACLLTPADDSCDLCTRSPEHDLCQMRAGWQRHTECLSGDDGACESVAEQFREGRGMGKSPVRAAEYYRRACDASAKTSCAALDDLCLAHPDLGDDLCHQSLIHTDLFYEAEWQFRQKGSASILTGDALEPAAEIQAKVSGAVSGAVSASASARLEFNRGRLDADLVVSVVLDRARQAAIRLVVDELRRAGRGDDVPRYLYDLLTQASLLLADQSTLRREKFQDLAMTVVRAFVASNLVETLYPTDAPGGVFAGAQVLRELTGTKLAKLTKLDKLDARLMRRYLTDWTYYLLGETKLFGRAAGEQVTFPPCPFTEGPGATLCTRFVRPDGSANTDELMKLLHVDLVLQGIALAKMVRAEGAIDLRRFVEAIGKSRSIANLMSTPGLDLAQWESEVIIGFRAQTIQLQERLEALRSLVRLAPRLDPADAQASEVVAQLEVHADLALQLLHDQLYASMLGRENHRRALELAQLVKDHAVKLRRSPLGGGTVQLDGLVDDIHAVFRRWDSASVAELVTRADELLGRIKAAKESIVELSRVVSDIRSLMARLNKGKGSFDIGELPLHEIPELKELFQRAAVALSRIDKDIQALFPNAARTKVRFAVSAVVRLLGFLDLMERVARKARLNQNCGDIIRAMKILGSVKESGFSAPLFDIMDPVLHAIETHEPMNTDLLFAMIARVRLDSLITSLASRGRKPCSTDSRGTECWTVKVIHALQESIQRDGDIIRVDGGKFAERLASHGDDFRRRNKWRSYFHLTVGFGGLLSLSPPLLSDTGAPITNGEDRTVPMISEQVGFGWASPVFWHDRLTFKTGIFASGILYRAVLDSAESNAIMVSPFVALDVYDLIELYAAPTLMFYPPIDDQQVGVRYGAMVGLSVPLSDYLERL